jgi:hypothetical protein
MLQTPYKQEGTILCKTGICQESISHDLFLYLPLFDENPLEDKKDIG